MDNSIGGEDMSHKLRVYRLSDAAVLVVTEEEAKKLGDLLKDRPYVEVEFAKNYDRWTVSECEKLRELALKGYDWSTIAKMLGRTVDAVRHKAYRLGIKRHQVSTVSSGQIKIDAYRSETT